jgi:hypothetical protein
VRHWARDDPNRLTGTGSFEYHRDLADARWWKYVCTLIPHTSAGTSRLTVSHTPVLTLNGASADHLDTHCLSALGSPDFALNLHQLSR